MNNHTHITRVAIFLNHLAESSAPQAPQPLPLTPQPARPASLWGLGALLRTWASLGAHPVQAFPYTHSKSWPVYEGWELFWGRGHHWGHTLLRHIQTHTADVGQFMRAGSSFEDVGITGGTPCSGISIYTQQKLASLWGWELFWGRGQDWGHALFRHFHIHTRTHTHTHSQHTTHMITCCNYEDWFYEAQCTQLWYTMTSTWCAMRLV